jgi:hypothetical protein
VKLKRVSVSVRSDVGIGSEPGHHRPGPGRSEIIDGTRAQGRPSFLGQIGDIPNRIHEVADAGEIGMKMMRHAQLTNGAGLRATVTIDGVWQVGSYMNMSPVLQLQGRVQCDGPGPSEPYVAVFDEVVAQLHTARMQPGVRVAVFVDPQNPVDMAIDWIRTGQLGPPPPGSTAGPGEPGARPAY